MTAVSVAARKGNFRHWNIEKNELREKLQAPLVVETKTEPEENFEVKELDSVRADLLPAGKIEATIDKEETAMGCDEYSCDIEDKASLSAVPEPEAVERRSPGDPSVPSDFEWPKCDKCGKIFAQESTLKTHLRTHDGHMPYQCDVCQARFSDWSTELIPHLRMHHNSVKSCPCHICGEEYVSRTCLKKHLRSHQGVEVSDSDGDLYDMKQHRRFKCDRCDCVFMARKARLRHIRVVHLVERDFTCNYCQRSFYSKGQLASHIRWHSEDRPYKCSFCTRAFKVQRSLTDHARIHTGECPYQCHVCGIMFVHANSFRRHLHFHSQVKRFKCDACGKVFTLKTTMAKHIQRTHPD